MEAISDYSKYRIEDIRNKTQRMGAYPFDILITGVTGAGKSTTLNTLFQRNVAPVGYGVDPETMEISHHSFNQYLRFWDTPGLGDGVEQDKLHGRKIIELLERTCSVGNNRTQMLIDLVVVIIEGSKRDLGTVNSLLEDIVVPHIQSNRILVAINQADAAQKGRNWDQEHNLPEQRLKEFLLKQSLSLKRRICETKGVSIHQPVYYSAKYEYNMDCFLDFIIDNLPTVRRMPLGG